MESILKDVRRCLKCRNALCQKACPINTPIPVINRLIEDEKYEEAAYMLFDNNPFSVVCSLICNHEKQCKGNCVLGIKGTAVDFPAIEHHISDAFFERIRIEKEPPNGKKVAVIGAGPAGMTIAILLAKKGYSPTIFEGRDKIGGVLQYGIPDFRLPKTILSRYSEKLHSIGVTIRPNITIGETLTVDDLLNDGYLSIFVGTGVWKPNKLRIPGESLGHVHYAIDYLANPEAFRLGERVAVIGVGNAAMDVARTALRINKAKETTLFARRGVSVANSDEIEAAKLDGAKFRYFRKPVRIKEEGVIFEIMKEQDGIIVSTEQEELYPCDSVIISVSQGPRNRIVTTTDHLDTTDRGLLIVNEDGKTTRKGIFAAGDVVHGAKTAVDAVAKAKLIAQAMHEYMSTI